MHILIERCVVVRHLMCPKIQAHSQLSGICSFKCIFFFCLNGTAFFSGPFSFYSFSPIRRSYDSQRTHTLTHHSFCLFTFIIIIILVRIFSFIGVHMQFKLNRCTSAIQFLFLTLSIAYSLVQFIYIKIESRSSRYLFNFFQVFSIIDGVCVYVHSQDNNNNKILIQFEKKFDHIESGTIFHSSKWQPTPDILSQMQHSIVTFLVFRFNFFSIGVHWSRDQRWKKTERRLCDLCSVCIRCVHEENSVLVIALKNHFWNEKFLMCFFNVLWFFYIQVPKYIRYTQWILLHWFFGMWDTRIWNYSLSQ